MTKSNVGRKWYFILQFWDHSLSLGEVKARSLRRNLEVETEAEAMEECSLLTCSSWFAQLYCLKPTRTTCPGVVPPPMGWALSHQSLIKKCSISLPTDQFGGGIFSVEFSSSQATVACVDVTENQDNNLNHAWVGFLFVFCLFCWFFLCVYFCNPFIIIVIVILFFVVCMSVYLVPKEAQKRS